MRVQLLDQFVDVLTEPVQIDRPCLQCKETCHWDVESSGDGMEGFDGDIDLTSFNTTVVAGVKVSLVSDILLCEALLLPETSYVETKGSEVGLRHRISLLPPKLCYSYV